MMLNNRFAGDVLEKMAILKDAGIDMNCQIVLCKGINDKEDLDRTLKDLRVMYPAVKSVSVVPVGLTKYREGLFPLVPFEKKDCIEVIDQVESFQKRCKEEIMINFVYIADEMYIKAGREIPEHDEYDGFPQIENGVGLLSSFRQEIYEHLEELKNGRRRSCPFGFSKKKTISIATGTLVYKYIKQFVGSIQSVFKNITVNIYPIENDFFGRSVTVTGLITGQDVITQLNNKDLGRELLLSQSMFKADEDVFLDGMTRKLMEEYLNVRVTPVMNNGRDFVESIIR
jgi:putative radical SAM enzyme (TIGR03279 family)